MSRRFTPEEGAQRAFYDDAYLQYHRAAYDNLCANGKLFTGIKRPRGKGFRQMTRKQCFANAQCVAVLGNNLVV